jgi:hypothetical protein
MTYIDFSRQCSAYVQKQVIGGLLNEEGTLDVIGFSFIFANRSRKHDWTIDVGATIPAR